MISNRALFGLLLMLAVSQVGVADDSILPVYNLQPINSELQPANATEVPPVSTTVQPVQNCYDPSTACDNSKLFGLFASSDHGFCNFISPMTNPVYFEDPRTLTEVRPIFAHHTIPDALGGGSAQFIAMQARAALTENLSIIATKDGFFFSENGLMSNGFADVNAGLKYNLYKDYCSQTIVSTGFTYGIPLGSHQSLQGKGNGEFNMFLSGGKQLGDDWHLISTFGARIPANTDLQTQSTYFSNHLDRKLGNTGLYVFTEANWYHWLSSANSFPVPVEGLDLFNLGSVGVAGNDIVTGAYGIKYKPNRSVEIGVAYEIPYTERRDIIQNRLTADLILRF